MRVSGLATGMDTESIIRDMMEAQRLPLNKITQKKQYLEWQLDDYRKVNRDLFDFSQNTFSNMILSNSFTAKTVSISAPDDVAIRNVSSTSDFSGTIQIHQLARNATMQGTKEIIFEDNEPLSSTLADLDIVASDDDGDLSITINAIGKDGKMPNDGVTLKFESTDTLQSVLDKINKETGVNAFFDSFTGQIGITAKNSGGADRAEIIISGDIALGLGINGNNKDNQGTRGQNAIFTFNGLRTQRTSNTFQIDGFEMTLKQVTASFEETAEENPDWKTRKVDSNVKTVTFSSSADTDKIMDTVVKFVDEYNKLIEELNAKLREPKYRDFHPLSQEQKNEMKEREIELWEEKAMSGTLRNDSIISSMLTKMRSALMGKVGDEGTLQDIGITTSIDYLDHGKLLIDEKALREAISADPNKVHELFAKDGTTEADKGFARRLREVVDDTQKLISARAGKADSVNDTFTLGRNLNAMDKQIERFQARLATTEDRLWKQFTAMEMAIQRANAQSAQLMSAFGGTM